MAGNGESPDATSGGANTTVRLLICPSCGAKLHGDPTCPSCGEPYRVTGSEEGVSALVREMRTRLSAALEGRYELRGLLGAGGMGAVFLAVELSLERLVAIKVLPPTLSVDEELLVRFEREARTAARLDHPGIVPIYSVEEVDGLHFFVMKFVPGTSLADEVAGGAMDVDRTRDILGQAAAALAHAHDRGVIHRDVKPANIMLDADGNVVLADFGIAKAARSGTQVTSTGQALGSPQYMAPEQFEGGDIDGRADQYALGMVAYHMLSGSAPFEGASHASVLVKQVMSYPESLDEVRSGLPGELVDVVERAIRKDPDERFPDMHAFAAAIRGGAAGGAGGTAGTRMATAGAGGSGGTARDRSRAATLAVSVAALGVAGVASWWALTGSDGPADGEGVEGTSPVAGSGIDDLGPDSVPGIGSIEGVAEALAEAQRIRDAVRRQQSADAGGASVGDGASGADQPASEEPGRAGGSEEAPAPVQPPPTGRGTAGGQTRSAPAAERGFLTVNAQPVFAFVEVDGVELPSSTPVFRHALAPGTHVLTIRREGFETVVDTVEVTAGNETRRNYVLIANDAVRR